MPLPPPSSCAIDEHYDPRGHVEQLVRAAVVAALPADALEHHWPPELRNISCHVLAVGKAAGTMMQAVLHRNLCGVKASFVIGVPGVTASVYGATVFEADHPLPTEKNVAASRRAVEFLDTTRERNMPLIVLLSGGASALMTLPVESLTLDDCRAITRALLRSGASIEELNCVRKHLEVLKGGGVIRRIAPLPVWTLILSDVIGDDLASIGSGPTCGDPTTFGDALDILRKYNLRDAAPAVTRILEEGAAGKRPETLKPRDPLLASVHHRIISNNVTAAEAVARRAREIGFGCFSTLNARGEARELGRTIARRALQLQPVTRPTCLIYGGETTVTVTGNGTGGRNQEIALAAAIELAESNAERKGEIVIASFSTDGVDGPTDAAGAVATRGTVQDGASKGLDAARALANNDSYSFFRTIGGLIRTGPTGTNVNDITVALVYPPSELPVGASLTRESRELGTHASPEVSGT